MSSELTYIIKLASWIGHSLGRSNVLFANFQTGMLGTMLPASVTESATVKPILQNAEQISLKLVTASDKLEELGAADDVSKMILAFAEFAESLIEFFTILDQLESSIKDQINATNFPDNDQLVIAQNFSQDLKKKLINFIVGATLTEHQPFISFILRIAGLLDWGRVEPESENLTSLAYIDSTLRLERINTLFTDPELHFREFIGWGEDSFDPIQIFKIYKELHHRLASIDVGKEDDNAFVRYPNVTLRRVAGTPSYLQLELDANLEVNQGFREDFYESWSRGFSSSLSLSGAVAVDIKPPLSLALKPTEGVIEGELKGYLNRNTEMRPFDILGDNGLIDLSAEDVSIGISLEAGWDALEGKAEVTPIIFSEIKGATLRLGSSDADSFVSSILSDAEIEGEFDLALEWVVTQGLRVRASGGIEIALPVHQSLGPVDIETLFLALNIRDSGALAFEGSTSLKGELGPLAVSIERVGVEIEMSFPEDSNARFGFFDLDLGFKPPDGVGLSLDASVLKGGGYLSFDSNREEYAGALELVFSEWITLKAIGMITTKMPDGSKGFSLLVIITAEFDTGFQLGLGFTLDAVGGLLGLNRTVRIEPLKEGVRTGSINSVMFPKDVIKNAPRIISDLRTFFPPENDIFLIGPMAKIGWGTPTLISLSLGVIIEIPSINITILGILKVVLPDEEAALLVLQVNFIGRFEPGKKRAWFYATMFESRVLFMTIDGGMGLLIAWGDDANFVISVGGFHPAYNPPSLPFDEPRRISINILNESYARIRVEGYFAVTSNSVQFGSRTDIYVGVSAFNIDGHISFDALFQFSPFYFIIEISASLSVKAFGFGLFSVRMRGALEGPTPWKIDGSGSISLLFFSIGVDFSFTWGDEAETLLPPIEVMPILEAEFNKLENWIAELPNENHVSVTLRKLKGSTVENSEKVVVLHPVGVLKVSQRAIPLGLRLDKVGNQKPNDVKKVTVEVAGNLKKKKEIAESFAIAQFQDMEDAEKLSSPAFEKIQGGVELSAKAVRSQMGRAVKRVIRYETIIIDSMFKRHVIPFVSIFADFFVHFLNGNAISKSPLSFKLKNQKQLIQEKIVVNSNLYVVALNTNNELINPQAVEFTSYVMAKQYMDEQISIDPDLRDSLHVIPEYELQKAA